MKHKRVLRRFLMSGLILWGGWVCPAAPAGPVEAGASLERPEAILVTPFLLDAESVQQDQGALHRDGQKCNKPGSPEAGR